MAPHPLYPGKRIQRRRRRRSNDCSRCRGQESSGIPASGQPEGAPSVALGPGVECASVARRQRIWESRLGETTEYFMKLSTIILALVSGALAIALIAVHYS